MTASGFDGALKRVLVHEDGYADHPADPGGATMQGITQRVYDGWRRRHGQPARPVRRIAPDEMAAIYRRQYWDAVRADDLPAGLDYALFDAAVNSGPAQAAKWLQRTLGVTADGQVGEATLVALDGRAPAQLIDALCDRRLAMLRSLRTFPTFGAGWTRRVAEVRAAAKA
ncbi:glycoside hydrolase family 108 protein, partial [Ancylobacter polymorphus]